MCQFDDPTHTPQCTDIDPFFTVFGKAPITSRFLISATPPWGTRTEEAMHTQ
ncbi:MAG: restriction endonuclease [Burkholderiales bacterium]